MNGTPRRQKLLVRVNRIVLLGGLNRSCKGSDQESLVRLMRYHSPGNVHQLEDESAHEGTMMRNLFQYSGGAVFHHAINQRATAEFIVPNSPAEGPDA